MTNHTPVSLTPHPWLELDANVATAVACGNVEACGKGYAQLAGTSDASAGCGDGDGGRRCDGGGCARGCAGTADAPACLFPPLPCRNILLMAQFSRHHNLVVEEISERCSVIDM